MFLHRVRINKIHSVDAEESKPPFCGYEILIWSLNMYKQRKFRLIVTIIFQEEKKSLKERLQAIQEVTQTVQNSIGYIASLCEKVKNLFNFTIPYLSYLAMLLTIVAAVVLYFIPIRYLILAWGVNKFSRKIFRPHSVPNNELLDLISRVPDDEELLNYK